MGRVIFHVGPEKTGSTLLQTYFEANAPRIVDASGRQAVMMYPAQVRNSGLLAEAQAVIASGDGALPGLQELIADHPDRTVIVSHESLFGHPDSAGFYGSDGTRRRLIELMVQGAAGREVEFIAYYKPPHKLLESYYRHHVMHGGRLGVMDYLTKVPLLKMSFLAIRDDMVAAVGANRVTIMDSAIENPEAFFRRFCAALQLEPGSEPLNVPADTNQSWSALKIEMARVVNGRLSPDERREWLRAMARLNIGAEANPPFVPAIITQLVERLYANEQHIITKLIADDHNRRLS